MVKFDIFQIHIWYNCIGGIYIKATGILRRVDELGRIVLPVELRRTLEIADRDLLEIYTDDRNCIVLKPHRTSCIFCGGVKDVTMFRDKHICGKCLRELRKKDEK